jgi:DNA primase
VDPSVAQGKYVNTPETALYHKSKILFGYDTAKKKMAEEKSVVVVEGQMDLCMSYQAGVHNTVAVSGTAFTDEHINLIKRFCDKVVLSFDTDQAGQNALKKTALLCLLGGLDVYVVENLGTKDPADLIKDNPLAWKEIIEKKRHVIQVMLGVVLETEKDSRTQGKRIVAEVLPFVRALPSPIDRAHFVKVVSETAGIPQVTLMEELARGVLAHVTEEESVTLPRTTAKERIVRELIAHATLNDKLADEEFIALAIDTTQFPEAVIQEEMFKLEEKLVGDKDRYFKDLIRAYRKEQGREELQNLQEKMKVEGADTEAILKQIYELVKQGTASN